MPCDKRSVLAADQTGSHQRDPHLRHGLEALSEEPGQPIDDREPAAP